MGGKSTSNSAVLNSSGKPHGAAFDLRSWQGLTYVLKAGKDSIKDQSAYAEFRNLVLEYAQKGGDEELRKKIEAITRTFISQKEVHVTQRDEKPAPAVAEKAVAAPVSTPTEEKPAPVAPKKLDVLARRPVPSFIPRSMTTHADDVSAEEPAVASHEAVTDTRVEVKPDVEDEVKAEVNVTDEPAPEEIVVTMPPRPKSVEPAPSMEKVAVHKTLDEHKARIAEIKRLVHDKVGNPAALIDTHNDAGKKYMMALLTALKATSAGSPVSIDTAMVSLEDAYTALISAASVSKEESKEKAAPPVVPPPVAMPPQEKKTVSVPPQATPAMKHSPAEIIAALAEDRKRSDIKASQQTPHVSKQTPSPQPPKPAPRNVPPPAVPAHAETTTKPAPVVPVAEVRSVVTPKVSEHTVHQSDLFTPEVSKALDGLLHEWKLFSGSGIFGIGPGGTEHPLYQTLAQLSMGEVLAGRWEKADAKAIRVIKEYVDAWRHEQGIAYTINETFEHYLRRVVQRILKRQSQ